MSTGGKSVPCHHLLLSNPHRLQTTQAPTNDAYGERLNAVIQEEVATKQSPPKT